VVFKSGSFQTLTKTEMGTKISAENPFDVPWQTGMGVVVVKSSKWLLYDRRVC